MFPMRGPILLVLALLAAAPLASQAEPRRPRLAAQADTNDARAYFQQGQEWLERRPRDAADAFYWASQIQPGWADALYGRHVALLMSEPRRLLGYMDGDRRTLRQPEVRRIDSLFLRATRIDPLLQPRFEREMTRLWMRTALASAYGAEQADMPLVAFYTEQVLRDLPPLMRGRVLAGEGRLVQALAAYDQALRERGRRAAPARMIRFERGRMFALARNDSMALVELRLAIDAVVEEEEGDDLVVFYESKALLEHGMGRVHESAGNPAAARAAYARALVEDLAYYPAHMRLGALALA
jgi:tetratricopeptide (TPR) repeat protein